MQELRNTLRPEFLNRIDEVVIFHPLGRDEIARIVDIQLTGLRKRLETGASTSRSPTRPARCWPARATIRRSARGRSSGPSSASCRIHSRCTCSSASSWRATRSWWTPTARRLRSARRARPKWWISHVGGPEMAPHTPSGSSNPPLPCDHLNSHDFSATAASRLDRARCADHGHDGRLGPAGRVRRVHQADGGRIRLEPRALSGAAAISLLLLGAAGPFGRPARRPLGSAPGDRARAAPAGHGTIGSAFVQKLWHVYVTAGLFMALGAGGVALTTGSSVIARWFEGGVGSPSASRRRHVGRPAHRHSARAGNHVLLRLAHLVPVAGRGAARARPPGGRVAHPPTIRRTATCVPTAPPG